MIEFNLSPVYCACNGVLVLEQSPESILFGILEQNEGLCKKLTDRYQQYLKNFKVFTSSKNIDSFVHFKRISKEFFIKETAKKFAIPSEQQIDSINVNSDTEQKLHVIEDAPIVNLLNSLILECSEKKGSDIHIEPFENYSKIRMRILGDLEEYSTIDKNTSIALLLRILYLANLNITENRRIQDGAFEFKTDKLCFDIRVSVLPSHYGSSIVLRLLNCKELPLTFKSLGFDTYSTDFLTSLALKSKGLVLVSGATGAGKSTTLAAILKKISATNRKIITIEDPVEYRIEGIVQVPVKADIEMDFSQVLRGTFRHDPDVIMIGEIRDEKTAKIAVRAALTGHLVLASIHAFDAPSAIIRLLDMGVESWLLSSVFEGVFYQELVQSYVDNKKIIMPKTEILPSSLEVKNLIHKKASLYEYSKKNEEVFDVFEVNR